MFSTPMSFIFDNLGSSFSSNPNDDKPPNNINKMPKENRINYREMYTEVDSYRDFVTHFASCCVVRLVYLNIISKMNENGSYQQLVDELAKKLTGSLDFTEILSRNSNPILSVLLNLFMPKNRRDDLYSSNTLLIELLNDFDYDNYKDVEKQLIDIADDIFESYEIPILRVTTDKGPKNAIILLAAEAASRVINYALYNNRGLLTQESVACKQKSKPEMVTYLYDGYAFEWKVSRLYEKCGVFIFINGSYEFYSIFRSKEYPFRRPFKDECIEDIKLKYKLLKRVPAVYFHPQYFLQKSAFTYASQVVKICKYNLNILDENTTTELIKDTRKSLLINIKELFIDQLSIKEAIPLLKEIQTYIENQKMGDILNEVTKRFTNGNKRRRLTKLKPVITINFQMRDPVANFTGRQSELTELHSALRNSNTTALISQTALVNVPGGVGKTELALKYAHVYSSVYKHKIFINSENKEIAIDSFKELAYMLEIDIVKNKDNFKREKHVRSLAAEIYSILSRNGAKTLLIFDNAEKFKDIIDFLPMSRPQHLEIFSEYVNISRYVTVLITTRNREWKFEEERKVVEVHLNMFTPEESIEYVQKSLINKGIEGTESLVDAMNYFPLALTHAVGYINQQNDMPRDTVFTAADYVNSFRIFESKYVMPSEVCDQNIENSNKLLMTTCSMSREKLTENEDYGILAINLLDIMAFINPDHIDVENVFKTLETGEKLLNATTLLKSYSMIHLENGIATLHKLVQEVTRSILKKDDVENMCIQETLNLLDTSDFETHSAFAWMHASHYADIVSEYYDDATYGFKLNKPEHLIAKYFDTVEVLKIFIEHCKYYDNILLNRCSESALEIAIKCGHVNTARYYLGIDNDSDFSYDNKLIYAVENRSLELFQVLVDKIHIDSLCRKELESLLFCAIAFNGFDILEFMIHVFDGVNQIFQSSDDILPIENAINEDYAETVEVIINCITDENSRNQMIRTSMFLAAELGCSNVIKMFGKRGVDFTITTAESKTLLHTAVENCGVNLIPLLIEYGVGIDAVCNDGCTALHYITTFPDSKDIIKTLIKSGANIEIKNNVGNTPLHVATIDGNLKVIKLLLKNGADIMATDNEEDTALHLASSEGRLYINELLLKHGADIHAKNKYGSTPLHCATSFNGIFAVYFLIKHGADVNATDSSGNTALHIASMRFNDKPLFSGFTDPNVSLASFLSAFVNFTQYNYGKYMRYLNSINKKSNVFDILIDNGADLKALNEDNNTPLDLAARFNLNSSAFRYLIKKGADVNAMNDNFPRKLYSADHDSEEDSDEDYEMATPSTSKN